MRTRAARILSIAAVATATCALQAFAQPVIGSDQDHPAPFNYGYGNGVRIPSGQFSVWNRVANSLTGTAATPFDSQRSIETLPHTLVAPPLNGGPNAAVNGLFGPILPWPIVPLHMALLPDGRVMNYGTDQNGKQGAALWYDVWDPTQPYETSQTVLPNVTGTDIFCSGLGLLPNGSLLITGGDLTTLGKRNYSNANVNVFSPSTNTLVANGTMNTPRWYPSDVPLTSGDHLIVGGRTTQLPAVYNSVPEYYSVAANTFTRLTGANSAQKVSWYYPKVFVTSSGAINLVDLSGSMATISTSGAGSFTLMKQKANPGLYDVPTVMYQPSKLFSIRKSNSVTADSETYTFNNIDLTGATPVVTVAPSVPGNGREWSNMTVLADGKLFVNGGSGADNKLTNVSYVSYIYDPAAQTWTQGGTSVVPRLYHSASLLLPDATVLTGGGGSPGPANQLNAEIYYPPYLFMNDGSGNFATRPVIASAPTTVLPASTFALTMGDDTAISRITLARVGAVTHSTSLQTRFIDATWTQDGANLTVKAPANTNDFLTGYWMVFVFNASGVPSIASIFQVPQPGTYAPK